MAATSREMLFNSRGLVVNAYHDGEGRQNYFPGSSGTSEGQFAMISGCLEAYLATGDTLAKDLAELALSGVLSSLYRNASVPDKVEGTDIFAPHWLFNVKYPFPASTIHLYEKFNFVHGVAVIPDPDRNVRYVWHVRSADSQLLWDNPFSNLSRGTLYPIESRVEIPDGGGTRITLVNKNITGLQYIAFSRLDGEIIVPNEPFEAWPDWRALERGEIDCAVDTLVWANHAFELAYQVFGNPTWAEAARATREQAVLAFDINDSRDWMKPSWSRDPFSVGSTFSFSNRQPAPVFSRDATGRILITAGKSYGEVQFGNASRNDVYREGDSTEITIGSSKKLVIKLYIDKFQNYSKPDRYVANVQLNGQGLQKIVLHNTDFISLGPNKDFLAAGSPVYTFGVISDTYVAHQITIERVRQRPNLDVLYYPGAIPFTANFLGSPAQLIDWRGPVYAGYQSPDMWVTIGNQPAAATCIQLLSDSQDAFLAANGGLKGPFAPVFYFNRSDAVQYGTPDTFGWAGPDENTKWGGYQYRPLVELAKATWVLEEPAATKAGEIVTTFLDFLADPAVWPPGGGPPSDYPEGVPNGEVNYNEPHFTALIMRAVIYYDKKLRPLGNADGPMTATHRTVMDKGMQLLNLMWQSTGVMKGTFSGQPEIHEWYGFHHAEILTTFAQAIMWGEGPAAEPEIAAQARLWIRDMLRWARANVYTDPSVYGEFLWSPPMDWSSALEETFSWQTSIQTAYSGKEQRIGMRAYPRRQLSLRHMLSGRESQQYDFLTRQYQSTPVLVPQWHMTQELAQDSPTGWLSLTLTEPANALLEWGGQVALSFGRESELVNVTSIEGATLTLSTALKNDWPVGTRVCPTMRGLLNTDQSSSRVTSSVTTAGTIFDMLPQEDRRDLPERVAPMTFTANGETRELVTVLPNWRENVSLSDTWNYDTVAYADGPILPIAREYEGRRMFSFLWSLYTPERIEQFLALAARLKGRLSAVWLPSGMLDLEIRQDITTTALLRVEASPLVTSRLINDKSMGVVVRTTSGEMFPARVISFQETEAGLTLALDRNFPRAIAMDEVAMINIMYRVRAGSDSVTLSWKTDDKVEVSMTFMTVIEEI